MKIQTTISGLRFRPLPTIQVSQLLRLDLLAAALFVTWSIFFIGQTSFVAIDGQRYFSLFDDAMISMRYAWNFSHGIGLVWNVGEHVEGYSNLLMTLIMSAATFLFDKKTAVLAIQFLGIPTALGVALLTKQCSLWLYDRNEHIADLAFIGILFYAPLWYWSLMGMEAGLLTLLVLAGFLCSLRWLETRRPRELLFASILLGLAFLTRNESLLLAALVFGYLAYQIARSGEKKAGFLALFQAIMLYEMIVGGQLAFRFWYYGQLLPNTYLLKVTGFPLSLKLRWGLDYVWPFLAQSWPLIGLALVGVAWSRFKNTIMVLFLAVMLVYQVGVGGDSFSLWRILVPGMPFVFILAASAITNLADWSARQVSRRGARSVLSELPLALMVLILIVVNLPAWSRVYNSAGQNLQAVYNQHNVNVALGIDALTTQDASMGVIWAGAIPYYANRKAIDFLGKSDTYIASLPAHLDMSLIGHNKYDLQYSIRKLGPTYIQDFEWGRENLRPWAVKHYVRANYATPYGDITLILKRDDPSIFWDKVTIIPWAEEAH